MTDNFSDAQPALITPAENAFSVTPGASALSNVTRAIYVGGAGTVVLTTKGGETVSFVGVPAGTVLPVRATHILSSDGGSPAVSTDATNIIGLY